LSHISSSHINTDTFNVKDTKKEISLSALENSENHNMYLPYVKLCLIQELMTSLKYIHLSARSRAFSCN